MIARTVSVGWQTILADLSLILFMVTASALADTPDTPGGPLGTDKGTRAAQPMTEPRAAPAPEVAPSSRAEPVAVWQAGLGAPPLARWLNEVQRDPRLRLTITVHYAPGGRVAALTEASRLDLAAGKRGETARIVVEPGQPAGANAVVGYDAPDADAVAGTQLAEHGA